MCTVFVNGAEYMDMYFLNYVPSKFDRRTPFTGNCMRTDTKYRMARVLHISPVDGLGICVSGKRRSENILTSKRNARSLE